MDLPSKSKDIRKVTVTETLLRNVNVVVKMRTPHTGMKGQAGNTKTKHFLNILNNHSLSTAGILDLAQK